MFSLSTYNAVFKTQILEDAPARKESPLCSAHSQPSILSKGESRDFKDSFPCSVLPLSSFVTLGRNAKLPV